MQQHEVGLIYSSVQLHPFSTMVALHGAFTAGSRTLHHVNPFRTPVLRAFGRLCKRMSTLL
jgi:hypothetical protein